jgi:hypothetical protein
MSSYPVHRSLPPTRRSSSDENLVPGEVQDKPPKPHAKLSLLRAERIASKGLHCPRYVEVSPRSDTTSSASIRVLARLATMHRTEDGHSTGRREDACPDDG